MIRCVRSSPQKCQPTMCRGRTLTRCPSALPKRTPTIGPPLRAIFQPSTPNYRTVVGGRLQKTSTLDIWSDVAGVEIVDCLGKCREKSLSRGSHRLRTIELPPVSSPPVTPFSFVLASYQAGAAQPLKRRCTPLPHDSLNSGAIPVVKNDSDKIKSPILTPFLERQAIRLYAATVAIATDAYESVGAEIVDDGVSNA
jgi:hypothetical protein